MPVELPLATAAVAALFAGVHVLSPVLGFLDRTPRSIWLSAAGGISVAYIFIHLLPDLAHHQSESVEADGWVGERGLFALALAGLVGFYGLERVARRHAMAPDSDSLSPVSMFRLHLGIFAIYNLLIAYILDDQAREGGEAMALYAIAMGLHYVVNDRALFRQYCRRYLHGGRWFLVGATVAGAALGWMVDIPDFWVASTFAFLGGGVIFNVFKEEIPVERESRFSAFALAAGAYTLLLLYV